MLMLLELPNGSMKTIWRAKASLISFQRMSWYARYFPVVTAPNLFLDLARRRYATFYQPKPKLRLLSDLSSLPMGALRRAQKVIPVKNPDISDSESESSQDSLNEDQALQKQEWSTKPRLDIAKRKNKHASVWTFFDIPYTLISLTVLRKSLPRDLLLGEEPLLMFRLQFVHYLSFSRCT